MKYELLLLDLDGTTVASKEKALPSRTVVDAVAEAKKHLIVSLATGRPFDLAKPVIDALKLTGLGIFNGGAEIIDMATEDVKWQRYLKVGTLQELVRLALPFGYDVYDGSDEYVKPISRPEEILEPAAKLFIDTVANKDAIHILEQLNGVPEASAHPTTSWNAGDVVDIHITHEHATKYHGAEQLIALLGLTKDQVIAVGDSHNDVPLLEAAGLKAVMGNAPDEVKKIADYIAPSLADDGVADVINRFVLIRQ
jgi:hydroxymethylpyrimidine pyrophosphatase-like HAD family hydrolase